MERQEKVREAKAVRLYSRGLTLHQVAHKLGMSPNGVRSCLQRAGVVLRRRGHPRTVDADRAVRLYATSMSLSEVAAELGVSKTGVWVALNRAGVLRTFTETAALKSEPVRQTVLDAWRSGLSARECAERTACSPDRTRRFLRQAGYDPNSRRYGRAGCGPLVRAARLAAGLNQSELARRIGWQPSRICDIERNYQRPLHRNLTKIAAALGCPVERLMPEAAEPAAAPRPEPGSQEPVRHPAPQSAARRPGRDVKRTPRR
jgi:transcriptional regulator with XRE-family HTH domain